MAARKVEFRKSGKTLEWDDSFDSILELAEIHGIPLDSECQQGYCGTCKVRLHSGEVDMTSTDGLDDQDVKENMILPCVSTPRTDIVLEA